MNKKPRFYIEHKIHCVAIIDRENMYPDLQPLRHDTPGVVKFWKKGHLSPVIYMDDVYALCQELNEEECKKMRIDAKEKMEEYRKIGRREYGFFDNHERTNYTNISFWSEATGIDKKTFRVLMDRYCQKAHCTLNRRHADVDLWQEVFDEFTITKNHENKCRVFILRFEDSAEIKNIPNSGPFTCNSEDEYLKMKEIACDAATRNSGFNICIYELVESVKIQHEPKAAWTNYRKEN